METLRRVPRYEIPCVPPRWARGGHAQTVLAHLLRVDAPRLEAASGYAPREVPLRDGERLVALTRAGESGVRVLLLHGLTGDANADYMRLSAAALAREGHGVWAVNHRGCGAGAGLAGRPYHSGKTEDLADLLAVSRADAPHLRHVVVGFSLSGNLVLLHAARNGPAGVDGLLAVNPAVDLLATTLAIGRGLSRLYERRFLRRLRHAVHEREARGLTRGSYRIPRGASLLEFDDLFTAPECGFADGRDYYRRCSSLPHLASVSTSGVILAAADDPFVDVAALRAAPRSPSLALHVVEHGGHVGYLTRSGRGVSRWLPGAVAHYATALGRPGADPGVLRTG